MKKLISILMVALVLLAEVTWISSAEDFSDYLWKISV